MNERELFTPEEAQNFKMPEDVEDTLETAENLSDTSEVIEPDHTEETIPNQPPQEQKPQTFDEIKNWLESEGTQESINEVQREMIKSFAALYEMMPHDGKVKKKDSLKAMEVIDALMEMGPAVRIQIAETIEDKKLNNKEKIDFVKTLMELEYVQVWMTSKGADKAREKENAKD